MPDRNLDLHSEIKSTGNGINESKFLKKFNCLKKIIEV